MRSLALTLVAVALLHKAALAAGPGFPTPEEVQDVCEYVATLPTGDRVLDYGFRYGVFDVNNDGAEEIVRHHHIGTMGGNFFEVVGTDGAVGISPLRIGEADPDHGGERWAGFGSVFVPHKGRIYLVNYAEEKLRALRYLLYLDPTKGWNWLCSFKTRFEAWPRASNPQDRAYCTTAVTGPAPVRVAETAVDLDTALKMDMPLRESYLARVVLVDFDNDGVVERLARVRYSSGAGRGCGYTFYDLLVTDGSAFGLGKKRDLLLRMQKVRPNIYRHDVPRCTGSDPYWSVEGAEARLVMKYRGDAPRAASQEFHTVSTVRNSEVVELCHTRYRVTSTVREINPDFSVQPAE